VTRSYDEFLAGVFDHLSPSLVALILLVVAVAAGVLWYTYPAWLGIRLRVRIRWPRLRLRWPAWRWPRFSRRPRRDKVRAGKREPEPAARTPEPDPEPRPSASPLSLADRLAAEGRYAEAIRERLRESVTVLSRYGVIAPAPAWTAHEVAARASANHPAVARPLSGATGIFSEVWYGRRPAGPDQDAVMRRLTAEIKAVLETPR
jgi:hypothetical protein